MEIAAFETYYTGSHKTWLDGLKHNSRHNIDLYTLKGKYWKWRMEAGVITLIQQINNKNSPDLIIASDMCNVALLKALLPENWRNIPILLYFHENQLVYPKSPKDTDALFKRENHYAFINYTSALCSNYCLFNSKFNMESFFKSLPIFLKAFPDHRNMYSLKSITEKSAVLPLGLDLKKLDEFKKGKAKKTRLLWNHRWESDKNPEAFVKLCLNLEAENLDFEVVIVGEEFKPGKEVFKVLYEKINNKIVHLGFAKNFKTYAELIHSCHILPVCSNQDFFGISIAEAIYCDVHACLPKRLSYPELFSNHAVLYETDDELFELCRDFILNPRTITNSTKNSILEYDWTNQIDLYDNTFEKFVSY